MSSNQLRLILKGSNYIHFVHKLLHPIDISLHALLPIYSFDIAVKDLSFLITKSIHYFKDYAAFETPIIDSEMSEHNF